MAKVLPAIYVVHRQPVHAHFMTLVAILPNCETAEKLALLALFAAVAKENPSVSFRAYLTIGLWSLIQEDVSPTRSSIFSC